MRSVNVSKTRLDGSFDRSLRRVVTVLPSTSSNGWHLDTVRKFDRGNGDAVMVVIVVGVRPDDGAVGQRRRLVCRLW